MNRLYTLSHLFLLALLSSYTMGSRQLRGSHRTQIGVSRSLQAQDKTLKLKESDSLDHELNISSSDGVNMHHATDNLESIWSLISNRSDMTILKQLVDEAGLKSIFNRTDATPMTVFLPMDSAFVSFFEEQGTSYDELVKLQGSILTDLILYHISGDAALNMSELTPGSIFTMNTGDVLTASMTLDGSLVLKDAAGRSTSIIEWDITAGSSIIYIISRVLVSVPPTTIDEALLYNAEFSMSRSAFMAAKYAGLLSSSKANVTLLVPTNSAWDAALESLNLTRDDFFTKCTLLPAIMSSLILPNVYNLLELEHKAGSNYFVTFNSCSELYTEVTDDNKVYFRGAGASAGQSATIIEPDLVAGQFALIQKLDAVIIPGSKWGNKSCRYGPSPSPPPSSLKRSPPFAPKN